MSLEFRKEFRVRDKNLEVIFREYESLFRFEIIKFKMKFVVVRISCWYVDVEKMES